METQRVERKLSAIFAADVEGYSRLMELDEVGTLRTLTAYRVIVDRLIASHRGRIFNTAGDSLVVDFASAVDAVQCAVEVQETTAKENADRPVGEQMRFRIGIHVGDIIVQGDSLFGDAVNVAARLEAYAEPGGICVSGTVQDQIGTKLSVGFIDLGEQQVKNIAQPTGGGGVLDRRRDDRSFDRRERRAVDAALFPAGAKGGSRSTGGCRASDSQGALPDGRAAARAETGEL